jgi:hypothetical protein
MTTTLLEAHRRFAAALDDLRRQYVADFDRWLRAGGSDQEAAEKIETARAKFADDFLDQHAPPIIRALNRDAEHDILHALRSFEARPMPLQVPLRRPSPFPLRWQASLWRTAVAAAFGAVAAVVLYALQPIAEPVTRETMIRSLIAAAFAAALGAAIGVAIMAAPPLDTLLARAGLRGLPLKIARKLGVAFAFLRAGPLITLSAVVLGGLFALIAWLLGGSNPLHVLFALMAIVALLTARMTTPDPANPDRDTLRRQLSARLDAELQADANVWAALAAALILKRDDVGSALATDLREITNLILARRAQRESGEEILQVIEQQLGLPCGAAASDPPAAAEFVWKSQHAREFDTFGAVDAGDLVSVSSQPLYVDDGDGGRRVSRKGLVTRKR